MTITDLQIYVAKNVMFVGCTIGAYTDNAVAPNTNEYQFIGSRIEEARNHLRPCIGNVGIARLVIEFHPVATLPECLPVGHKRPHGGKVDLPGVSRNGDIDALRH
jgi:acetamidase/formamidase